APGGGRTAGRAGGAARPASRAPPVPEDGDSHLLEGRPTPPAMSLRERFRARPVRARATGTALARPTRLGHDGRSGRGHHRPDTPVLARPMSEGGPAQAFPPGRSYVPAAVNRAPCPGDDGGVDAVAASPVMEAVGRLLTGQTRTVGAISTGRMFDPSGFLHAVHAHLEPASGTGQTGG